MEHINGLKARIAGRSRRAATAVLVAATTVLMSSSASAQEAELLFFASDVHGQRGSLGAVLDSLQTEFSGSGVQPEVVGIVGDLGSDTSQIDLDGVLDEIGRFEASPVLAHGNHDGDCCEPEEEGCFHTHATGKIQDASLDNQLYDIYVINSCHFPNANEELSDYLATDADSSRVLFVLSHYPIHSTRSDIDQNAARAIFNTLQAAGDTIDIVFLWGHNHSNASHDVGVDYVVLPGEKVNAEPSIGSNLIEDVAGQALNFTYLNAGYVKPIESSGESSGTGVLVTEKHVIIKRVGDAPFAHGDVNEDGEVSILDALLVAQYYVEQDPEDLTNLVAADVNLDGSISILDALLIAQYYVGTISFLPVLPEQ